MRTSIQIVCAVVAGVAVLIALAIGMEANTPNSTSGISIVGGNLARVPQGETFILTHHVGKVRQVWEITYDGSAVRFHCQSWPCSDLDTANLCGVNCTIDVDAGWGDHFYVSLREDGSANVEWPWGWDYRPHSS